MSGSITPAQNEHARRRARFTYLLRRARQMAEGEPKLTPDELRALAGIFGQAAGASDGEAGTAA